MTNKRNSKRPARPRSKNESTERNNRFSKKRPERTTKPDFNKEEFEGVVSMTREGYGFVVIPGVDTDIFVPAHKMRGALNGDKVRVVSTKEKGRGVDGKPKRLEGMIVDVLERSKKPHIGILQVNRNDAWLMIESRAMPYDIRVPFEELDRCFSGETAAEISGLKAAVIVEDWPRKESAPVGRIIDVLGEPGLNDTEMHAILTEFGLPYKFEENVENAADAISEKITKEDIAQRRDFRGVTTLTIDPKDAKDFDDALSILYLENGNLEIGVHIADVTHYVTPDSILDKAAYERATSVYLVDRTVPMLPEKLSNKLCSLRANEEKLCFSTVFEMNVKGEILNTWFGRTVINSDYRFDYEGAQEIIENQVGEYSKEVLELHRLATIIRKKRFASGAISFERPEMKVEVDSDGKPISVYQKVGKEANWLIEEFMLLANKAVAEVVGKVAKKAGRKSAEEDAANKSATAKTFVYRIHENPVPEKVDALRKFANLFGYNLGGNASAGKKGKGKVEGGEITGKNLSSALNVLLKEVKGTPEESAIEMMALRSMSRARYSTDNVGHYGLAFDYYSHFTSPIRRYPDMMVHRLLAMYLDEMASQDKSKYEAMCEHSSAREHLAVEAERASTKYKLVEFMQDKIGLTFDGTISGLTEWGMYVEIEPTKVEGMVPLRDVREDFYVFDEETYSIKGKGTGKKYMLGDKVRVKVKRASLEQKIIDYELVNSENSDTEALKSSME